MKFEYLHFIGIGFVCFTYFFRNWFQKKGFRYTTTRGILSILQFLICVGFMFFQSSFFEKTFFSVSVWYVVEYLYHGIDTVRYSKIFTSSIYHTILDSIHITFFPVSWIFFVFYRILLMLERWIGQRKDKPAFGLLPVFSLQQWFKTIRIIRDILMFYYFKHVFLILPCLIWIIHFCLILFGFISKKNSIPSKKKRFIPSLQNTLSKQEISLPSTTIPSFDSSIPHEVFDDIPAIETEDTIHSEKINDTAESFEKSNSNELNVEKGENVENSIDVNETKESMNLNVQNSMSDDKTNEGTNLNLENTTESHLEIREENFKEKTLSEITLDIMNMIQPDDHDSLEILQQVLGVFNPEQTRELEEKRRIAFEKDKIVREQEDAKRHLEDIKKKEEEKNEIFKEIDDFIQN